ncbi:MAG: radical SAM protein, partial [Myxococcota bacterium]
PRITGQKAQSLQMRDLLVNAKQQLSKRLVDRGVLEVTLLGQTINHYCYQHAVGRTTSFAELLFRIHEEVPHLQRLRFLTSYPRDFTDETLDVMASCDRICKYLHIPAQSGSDRILKKMNRGYTRQQYLELIQRARARMPDISLLGDMIVGFSSETQEDFELSLSLLKQVRYKNVFVFKYSPRPGTVSHRRQADDVPWQVKQERNRIMLQLQQEISLQHHTCLIGKQLQVLVEAKAKYDPCAVPIQRKATKRDGSLVRLSARTQGDHIVAFDGSQDFIGKCVPVRIVGATALTLRGEKVLQEVAT